VEEERRMGKGGVGFLIGYSPNRVEVLPETGLSYLEPHTDSRLLQQTLPKLLDLQLNP